MRPRVIQHYPALLAWRAIGTFPCVTEYDDALHAYRRASDVADQARQVWRAFLSTEPLADGQEPPPMSGNINKAYDTVAAAEAAETTARERLFAVIRAAG